MAHLHYGGVHQRFSAFTYLVSKNFISLPDLAKWKEFAGKCQTFVCALILYVKTHSYISYNALFNCKQCHSHRLKQQSHYIIHY